MRMSLPGLHSAAVLVLISACDTRADEKYAGDSLLHLEGRVVLQEDDASELVPALAFSTPEGLELVDVDVHGSFPNNFRIEVYSPPPAAARVDERTLTHLPPGVQVAIASIAAVPRDHLSKLFSSYSVSDLPTSALAACATARPACQRVERWCVDATERDCRTLGFPCKEAGSCPFTVSEGNPAIFDDPSDVLPGLAENVVIMWTRDGLPASSILSHELGLKQDLKAGYNLVGIGEVRDDEYDHDSDSDSTCTNCGPISEPEPEPEPEDSDAIEAEALARYNAAHGTDYVSAGAAYDELVDSAGEDTAITFEDDLYEIELQIKLEQGIDISELIGTRLIEDWRTRLVITVGPGLDFLF